MPNTLRGIVLGVLILCVLLVAGSVPAVASVDSPNAPVKVAVHVNMNKKQRKLCHQANVLRKAVIKKRGKRAPGRNICQEGRRDGSVPSVHKLQDYKGTLGRILHPPPPVVAPTPASPAVGPSAATSSTASSSSVAGSVLPSCASESGTNYSTGSDNTNPSTGATGRYQEIPAHRAPGGICYGIDLSPPGQDRCAVLIYQAQGAGAWTNCGG